MRRYLLALATLTAACSSSNASPTGASASSDAAAPAGLQKVNHVVVILLENWSFDSLYAEFPGAEGLTNALTAQPQIDPTTGQPYSTLPQAESHMPAGLPDAPFALDPYLTVSEDTSIDLTTNFYSEQEQIDDGKMDLFVAKSAAKGLTMGYFHTADLPLTRGSVDLSVSHREAKPAGDLVDGERCAKAASGASEFGLRVDGEGAQVALKVGPPELDRVELRAVGRQVDGQRPGGFDGVADPLHLVHVEVVHDDDVAAA
jgi:hypothetical protein